MILFFTVCIIVAIIILGLAIHSGLAELDGKLNRLQNDLCVVAAALRVIVEQRNASLDEEKKPYSHLIGMLERIAKTIPGGYRDAGDRN
jgi:hypothetical protein